MNEWDRQEALRDLGLEDVHNYRSCAKCGCPLIDPIFPNNSVMKQFESPKKVIDICTNCMMEKNELDF